MTNDVLATRMELLAQRIEVLEEKMAAIGPVAILSGRQEQCRAVGELRTRLDAFEKRVDDEVDDARARARCANETAERAFDRRDEWRARAEAAEKVVAQLAKQLGDADVHLRNALQADVADVVVVPRNWLEELARDLQRGLGPMGDDSVITAVQAALRLAAGKPRNDPPVSAASPPVCGWKLDGGLLCDQVRGHSAPHQATRAMALADCEREVTRLRNAIGRLASELAASATSGNVSASSIAARLRRIFDGDRAGVEPCGTLASSRPGTVPCSLPRGHAGRCGAYDGQTLVEAAKNEAGPGLCGLEWFDTVPVLGAWRCRRLAGHEGPCKRETPPL